MIIVIFIIKQTASVVEWLYENANKYIQVIFFSISVWCVCSSLLPLFQMKILLASLFCSPLLSFYMFLNEKFFTHFLFSLDLVSEVFVPHYYHCFKRSLLASFCCLLNGIIQLPYEDENLKLVIATRIEPDKQTGLALYRWIRLINSGVGRIRVNRSRKILRFNMILIVQIA